MKVKWLCLFDTLKGKKGMMLKWQLDEKKREGIKIFAATFTAFSFSSPPSKTKIMDTQEVAVYSEKLLLLKIC